ncbi:MAG TPA: hypothetical protein VGJ60_28050 [Chloroflexota bacterium]|jgi:hypothetical protein
MSRASAVVELVGADDEVDWESPAGPVESEAVPQAGVPKFFFIGPGERHWIGQHCDVLGSLPGDPSTRLVRLACGCRVLVPRTSLQCG